MRAAIVDAPGKSGSAALEAHANRSEAGLLLQYRGVTDRTPIAAALAPYAVLGRDDAQLHLWGATDDDWRSREDLDQQPICSGAESLLAGTASCRIEVSDVDALFTELQSAGVLHDVSRDGVSEADFGTQVENRPQTVGFWLL